MSAIGSVIVMVTWSSLPPRFPSQGLRRSGVGSGAARPTRTECGADAIRGDRVQLPAALADARQLAAVRHLAHADAAQPELAQHGAGTPALLAAGVAADGELRLPGRLDDERLLGHRSVLPEGEAEPTQQGPAFLVGGRRRDDGDVHAARAVDGVRVDLVEHRLLGEAEGVVAPAVEL